MPGRWLLTCVFAAAGVAGGAACQRNVIHEVDAPVTNRLCDGASAADGGDLAAARAAFEDVHADLHAMADDLTSADDRAAAGELLRAKQKVEADVAAAGSSAGDANALGPDLRALASQTARIEGAENACA